MSAETDTDFFHMFSDICSIFESMADHFCEMLTCFLICIDIHSTFSTGFRRNHPHFLSLRFFPLSSDPGNNSQRNNTSGSEHFLESHAVVCPYPHGYEPHNTCTGKKPVLLHLYHPHPGSSGNYHADMSNIVVLSQ